MKKRSKSRPKARVGISIRLRPSTLADIRLLGTKVSAPNLSGTVRFLIYRGFSSLGNWRKKEYVD